MIVHNVDQGSAEWFELRTGRPTASDFSKIITSKGEPSKSMTGYATLLAGEVYAGKPLDGFEGNQWTNRGKELEPDAKAMYEFTHDCDLEQVGFITDDLVRYGCSPDSLRDSDGMVEIKCLKAENHINAILYYKKHKKCPTDYIQQTQGQIFIAERAWCDLVFYHPDLPLLVIRQHRDDEFIKKLQNLLALTIQERDQILELLKTA